VETPQDCQDDSAFKSEPRLQTSAEHDVNSLLMRREQSAEAAKTGAADPQNVISRLYDMHNLLRKSKARAAGGEKVEGMAENRIETIKQAVNNQ